MRLFVAFLPSKKQILDIIQFQNKIKNQLSDWKLTKPEKIHLTFLFLGNDVKENKIEKILESLKKISDFKKFEVECNGVGAFPKPSYASVFWCRLKGDVLVNLANSIRDELALISFKDKKSFKPHLTIARTQVKKNISEFIQKFSNFQWANQNWIIDNIALICSTPSNTGYTYKIIQKFELK